VSPDESKAITEKMKAELKASGYTEDESGSWHWRDGFLAAYSAIFPSIDSAYRHYQEGQYFEAMETLIERVKDASTDIAEGETIDMLHGRLQSITNAYEKFKEGYKP
jgi:hypothetical protein